MSADIPSQSVRFPDSEKAFESLLRDLGVTQKVQEFEKFSHLVLNSFQINTQPFFNQANIQALADTTSSGLGVWASLAVGSAFGPAGFAVGTVVEGILKGGSSYFTGEEFSFKNIFTEQGHLALNHYMGMGARLLFAGLFPEASLLMPIFQGVSSMIVSQFVMKLARGEGFLSGAELENDFVHGVLGSTAAIAKNVFKLSAGVELLMSSGIQTTLGLYDTAVSSDWNNLTTADWIRSAGANLSDVMLHLSSGTKNLLAKQGEAVANGAKRAGAYVQQQAIYAKEFAEFAKEFNRDHPYATRALFAGGVGALSLLSHDHAALLGAAMLPLLGSALQSPHPTLPHYEGTYSKSDEGISKVVLVARANAPEQTITWKTYEDPQVENPLIRLAHMGFTDPEMAIATTDNRHDILQAAFKVTDGKTPSLDLLTTLSWCANRHSETGLEYAGNLMRQCQVPVDYVRRVLSDIRVYSLKRSDVFQFCNFVSSQVGGRSRSLWWKTWQHGINALEWSQVSFSDTQKVYQKFRGVGLSIENTSLLACHFFPMSLEDYFEQANKIVLQDLKPGQSIKDKIQSLRSEPVIRNQVNEKIDGSICIVLADGNTQMTHLFLNESGEIQSDMGKKFLVKVSCYFIDHVFVLQTLQLQGVRGDLVPQELRDWEIKSLRALVGFACAKQELTCIDMVTPHGLTHDAGILAWASVANINKVYGDELRRNGFRLKYFPRSNLPQNSGRHNFFWSKEVKNSF